MNFDKLPNEIKSKIFNMNKIREMHEKQLLKNKLKYNIVLEDLTGSSEDTLYFFGLLDRDENDIEDDEFYSSYLLEFIRSQSSESIE